MKHPNWKAYRAEDGQTRYGRTSGKGGFNLRRVWRVPVYGRPTGREWALYRGNQRVWEVQACSNARAACAQAEDWYKYEMEGEGRP